MACGIVAVGGAEAGAEVAVLGVRDCEAGFCGSLGGG